MFKDSLFYRTGSTREDKKKHNPALNYFGHTVCSALNILNMAHSDILGGEIDLEQTL